mgnify:CR=1 FL=1|jgi:ATP-binding cassette subfamily G (WHITE) protein 2 (SNQ2)
MATHDPSEVHLGPPIDTAAPTEQVHNNNNNNNAVPNSTAATSSLTNEHTRTGSSSSDGNTLANDDAVHGESSGKEGGLAAPKGQISMRSSAHSSMDHVAELGDGGVSVRRAKEEFAALERRFSNLSQHSQELHRSNTRRSTRSGFAKAEKVMSTQSSAPDASDAEKGKAGEEEEFDLAEVLRSGKEEREKAGLKRKQIGVVWEDLEVIGAGKWNVFHIVNQT